MYLAIPGKGTIYLTAYDQHRSPKGYQIHNFFYNLIVRITTQFLLPLMLYALMLKILHEWHDLQFKVASERQIFEKLYHGNFIYSQSFCQKSAESISL